MDLSVWSKSVPSSSSICLDSCSAEYFSVQPDFLPSNPDMTDHSVASNKTSDDNPHPELTSSKEAGHFSAGRHPSPTSSTCGYRDWSFNSGHHAKRARVENIIRGMTSSPAGHVTDATTDRREQSDGMWGRIQELPLHQEGRGSFGASHSQVTKTQLERRQLHLRQLRTNAIVSGGIHNINSSDQAKSSTCISSSETPPRGARADLYSELERSSSRKTQACKLIHQSKPERVKLMAEVLKYELSRAVSRSVDSIFRSMPLLQTPPDDDGSPQSAVCKDTEVCYGSAKAQVEDAQSEALSLVVQKPHMKRGDGKDLYCPKPPVSFSCNFTLQEGEPSQEAHNTAGQNAIRCFDVGRPQLDMFDTRWSSVKVRSKVNSRLARSLPVDVLPLRSPCLPLVKIESDDLMKTNIYMADEGLTTSHLKKAKLMFFYTRYPSSQTLKMCFHDVQFTRCITSQLIKWFSNFREFYYIQMEKFARHALMDGVTDVGCLAVGRESELFRALSMHYNKASDFQIPDRFLEVAEITLREFYVAISLGKDRDPSWKKAIYKVICKLDSDVPAEFKNTR